MAPFLYRCPTTGLNVQSWAADELPPGKEETFVSVSCTACRQVHLVSPRTGRVIRAGEG